MSSKLSLLLTQRCLRNTGFGFADRTQTKTSLLNAAQGKVASFSMRKTFTPMPRMCNAIAELRFASHVVWIRISRQTAKVLSSGGKRIPLKAQIFNGFLQTRKLVHLVSDKLRKIKVAFI